MKWFLAIAIVCALAAPPVSAGPSWSYQTYQLFDFQPDDFVGDPIVTPGSGPSGSDVYVYNVRATIDENPFGDPFTLVQVDTVYDNIPGVDGGYNAAGGYFHSFAIEVGSGMWIPNSQEPNPIKDIWVEIRYDPDLVNYEVELPDGDFDTRLVSFSDVHDPAAGDSDWHIAQIEWQIRPNPDYESLWFNFVDNGTKLDYIAVYTRCYAVPAPGGLILAGLGTGLVGWLRRRRKL